jgi:hypothetical protein
VFQRNILPPFLWSKKHGDGSRVSVPLKCYPSWSWIREKSVFSFQSAYSSLESAWEWEHFFVCVVGMWCARLEFISALSLLSDFICHNIILQHLVSLVTHLNYRGCLRGATPHVHRLVLPLLQHLLTLKGLQQVDYKCSYCNVLFFSSLGLDQGRGGIQCRNYYIIFLDDDLIRLKHVGEAIIIQELWVIFITKNWKTMQCSNCMYDLPDGDLITLRRTVEERTVRKFHNPSNSQYNNVAHHKKLNHQDYLCELNDLFFMISSLCRYGL